MNKIILGIETSCDDTSIAIIKNNKLLSNIIVNSIKQNKKYGGIVPELAARNHCKYIDKVCKLALTKAKLKITDITHIAYSSTPGLIGCLHIGKVFANQLGELLKIKPIKINHVVAHVFSYFIDHKWNNSIFPLLGLVVSGGNTFIALFKDINHWQILNETLDDSFGETLDKVGRKLSLKFPGGVSIDKIYDAKKVFFLINHQAPYKPFSFSGVKTKVLNLINSAKKIDKVSIASSLLYWIVEDVKIKLSFYLNKYKKVKCVLVGGGCSANSLLQKELSFKKTILFPKKEYTNDNAAMICNLAKILVK